MYNIYIYIDNIGAGQRRRTHVEGDDDAGGVVGGELDGRAEEAVLVHGRRDEPRPCASHAATSQSIGR